MFCIETPSPYGRRGQNGAAAPGRQKATKGGNEFVAICRNLPPFNSPSPRESPLILWLAARRQGCACGLHL